MCQGEGGSDSLTFIFVCEDGEQGSVHGGSVLEGTHGSCPSSDFPEAPFDGVGCSDLLALGEGVVLAAGEQFVEVIAQAGDGLGVGLLPGVGEAPCGAERLWPAGGVHDVVEAGFDGVPVGLADIVEDIPDLVGPGPVEEPDIYARRVSDYAAGAATSMFRTA